MSDATTVVWRRLLGRQIAHAFTVRLATGLPRERALCGVSAVETGNTWQAADPASSRPCTTCSRLTSRGAA